MKSYIKKVTGSFTKTEFWLVKWSDDSTYGWEYTFEGHVFGKDNFESLEEAIKSIESREYALSIGETVMV